jgi:hypothetical protein
MRKFRREAVSDKNHELLYEKLGDSLFKELNKQLALYVCMESAR